MTPSEWEAVAVEVKYLWGPSAKWERADRAYDMVRELGSDAVLSAVKQMFRNGMAHPPSMSEVASAAVIVVGDSTPVLRNPTECNHPQPWGFEIMDGERMAFCRYCYSEWSAPRIKSLGEIAEARQTRNVPV